MPVLALWSAPRARSTAFFRSMLERGDVVVVHEPFSDLAGLGETDVAGRPFTSTASLLRWLCEETDDVHVFLKDTPNRRHAEVFADRSFVAMAHHTFLIRRPEDIAESFLAVERSMDLDSIGLEHLHGLHSLVRATADREPLVIDADDLVDRPAAIMAAYCDAVGLPHLPSALTWEPGDQAEWRRSARWHRDVSASSGFERRTATPHEHTVDTSPELARFAAHHRPAYEALHALRLRG